MNNNEIGTFRSTFGGTRSLSFRPHREPVKVPHLPTDRNYEPALESEGNIVWARTDLRREPMLVSQPQR